MRHRRAALAVLTAVLLGAAPALAQLPGGVQVPGVPAALPSADQLLGQARQMVADLTSLKGSGKLGADQLKKVDELLPRASSLAGELSKPPIDSTRLAQLSRDLADVQKQVTALKGLVK